MLHDGIPITRARTVNRTLAAVLLATLAGCGSLFKSNEDAKVVVMKRVAGMPVGDFFEQYGRARVRQEQPDGATAYLWESSVGAARAGPAGLDDRICRLNIAADKRGRIDTVTIVHDTQGLVSSSRCSELFR